MKEYEKARQNGSKTRDERRSKLGPRARGIFDQLEANREGWSQFAKDQHACKTAASGLLALLHAPDLPEDTAASINDLIALLKKFAWEIDKKDKEGRKQSSELVEEFKKVEREERLEQLPLDKRNQGSDLLDQKDKDLAELDSPDAGYFGSVAGGVFGLEFQIEKAEKVGDEKRAKRLKRELGAALPIKMAVEEEMRVYKEQVAKIEEKYEVQLSSLKANTKGDPAD